MSRRRLVIAADCLPLATASVLHAMGRSGGFGLLREWSIMGGLTVVLILR
jgi:hypothetical protein